MKFVINGRFGCFKLPKEMLEELGCEDVYDDRMSVRKNPKLIKWVMDNAEKTDLEVIEFTDEATDYYIENYDGRESVIYVVDGKMNFIG